jgi:superfamily II DNA or RNA helicase
MKKAMDEINPDTGKPYLCSYKYYPILVELSAEENEEYIKLTKEIGRRYHTTKLRKIDDEKLTGLLIKRSNIKNNAHAKYDELKIIVPRFINQMNYCLIYCSGKQMDYIKLLLNQYKIIYHEFTQYTTPKIRQDILLKFEEGRKSGGYDVLLAIDCLNEGIDIPSARMGIFLENSQNPIEFIQRRGRLLRPHADKKEAILFDFIVIPNFYGLEENYKELEKRELQKEYNRLVEFAKLAKNTQEALKVMEKIADEYNLVVMNG